MKKYLTLLLILFYLPGFTGRTAENVLPVTPVVTDILRPSASAGLDGFIAGKLDAAYQNRMMAQNVDRLVSPFRNRTETSCWQSEFWGKWITSTILAYRYHPEPGLKSKLDEAVMHSSNRSLIKKREANRFPSHSVIILPQEIPGMSVPFSVYGSPN